ncbi:MAG: tetratricopeptide repeat protein, partial [Phycisphaerales bacterium]
MAAVMLALPACRTRQSTPPPAPVRSVPIEIARPATAPTPTQAERVEIAQQTADVGDYQEALRLFQSLLSENPTLTTAFIGIGDIHLAQGNYKEAE